MLRAVLATLLGLALLAGCDRGVEPFDADQTPQQPNPARMVPQAAQATGLLIRGTVRLAPGHEERARSSVLFVVARGPGGGPPLAVKRVQAPSFPLEFELGPGDRMVEARPFSGPLQLIARLDADGNATTLDPGDLQGAAPQPVNPGDSGIELLLE